MSNLIEAGYLPCVTKSNCESRLEQTRFISLEKNTIPFDSKSDYTSDSELSSSSETSSDISDNEEKPKQHRFSKLTKYDSVAANVSTYIANIKGI